MFMLNTYMYVHRQRWREKTRLIPMDLVITTTNQNTEALNSTFLAILIDNWAPVTFNLDTKTTIFEFFKTYGRV